MATVVADSDNAAASRRAVRYGLRDVLRHHSTLRRVRKCGLRRIDGSRPVTLTVDDGVSRWGNVAFCGSVHACPVCAPKVLAGRAAEINVGIDRWREQGGDVLFLTLTVPHRSNEPLGALLDLVLTGWRYMQQGRRYRGLRDTYGIDGFVRALDVTWSESNGWHPHLHLVLFVRGPLGKAQVRTLGRSLFVAWRDSVVTCGGGDVKPWCVKLFGGLDPARISRYVANLPKLAATWDLGSELARAYLKTRASGGAMNVWRMLLEFTETGELDLLDRWREWERASRGRQGIAWSAGLKGRLLVDDVTDEDLAAEPAPAGGVVVELSDRQWHAVQRTHGAMVAVMGVVELQGPDAAIRFLRSLEASLAREWRVRSEVVRYADRR